MEFHNLACKIIIYPIYLVLFLCIGTLYQYEICFVDSVHNIKQQVT